MRRWGATWCAGALLLAACGSSDSGVTQGTSSEIAAASSSTTSTSTTSTTAAPDPTDPPSPAVTDPAEAADTTPPTQPAVTTPATVAPPPDGAADPDGIGDALFPELGNPGIDVQDYDVQLAYDPKADTIVGSVTMQIAITEDRDQFTLDSVGPAIDAVIIDGSGVTFAEEDRELRITPAAPLTSGQQITVEVDYHAAPDAGSATSAGLPVGWFNTLGGSYVLNEPDGARTWLPSNDHPADKATWTFEITVPTGDTAVANGAHVSTTPGPSGDTWVWRQDQPMATYLIQLETGDYQLIDGTGPNGLPLLSVVLREDAAKMQVYVDTISEEIDFFDGFFGPYPLDRYGIAMTDSASGLAMETQGRSLFSRDDFSGSLGYVEQLLLSHELAHQWFGDAVTLARWQDIWLNESFATYGEWMWLDHVGLQTLDDAAQSALAQKQTIADESTADPTVDGLFGFNSYEGGAVTLQALRLTIGDDAFFTLLQRWVADNNGTSRTTADFIEQASKAAGTDLTAFFETWLFSTTVPSAYPSPA